MKEVNWKQNLLFLWLSQILSMAGFAGITPFIPLFLRDAYHITGDRELGMYVSALSFIGYMSFCFATPFWGILADKYGRKIMLLRSYYLMFLLFPLLYFMPNVWLFIGMRFVVSSFSGTTTAAQTLVVTNTPEEHHGFALGTLSTALWSGNMVGFLLGASVVNFFGYFWGFMVCGITYLLGGLMVQFFVRENFTPPLKTKTKTHTSVFAVPHTIFLLFILFLFMGTARRFDEPYISILVSLVGGAGSAIYYTGVISAFAAGGGFLSGILMGKLCDRYPPGAIALPAILLAAFTMVLQATAESLTMLGGARFLHFTAAGGLEPAFQTMLSKVCPPERRGAIFGMVSSLRVAGILLSALLSGGVIYFWGIRAVFFGSGLAFLCLLPPLFLLMRSLGKSQNQPST